VPPRHIGRMVETVVSVVDCVLLEISGLRLLFDVQYAEQYENQMFQYGWALRHQNKVSAKTE